MKRQRLLFGLTIAFLFILLLSSVLSRRVVVISGSSMEPTLHDGDIAPITLIDNAKALPDNYPVCWVDLPNGESVVKRLIGYPGDTVELIDGATYVNGKLIMESPNNCWDNMKFELGDNQYLFLGDNRTESYDAREWEKPFVGIESIRGYLNGSGLPLKE